MVEFVNLMSWYETVANVRSKLLSETSTIVTGKFQNILKELEMLKALSSETTSEAEKLSDEVSAILATISSLPDYSRQIDKISQGVEDVVRLLSSTLPSLDNLLLQSMLTT